MIATNLNPLTLPLQGQQLIEASAGTGKTYTLAALYVRLILGHQQLFDQGERLLLPPDILVMTFTDAATAELRERIRLRLQEAKTAFQQGHSSDPFLSALLAEFKAVDYLLCEQKLSLAIEWMDEAAIFTIHGWANRMLKQHAFDSLSLFEQVLVKETYPLKLMACKTYWRRFYYGLDAQAAEAVQRWVNTPEALLSAIDNEKITPESQHEPLDFIADPQQALAAWTRWNQQLLACFKQLQDHWTDEVSDMIRQAKVKDLNATYYKDGWLTQLSDWLKTGNNPPSLKQLIQVSRGGFITKDKGNAPQHAAFDAMAGYVSLLVQEPDYQSALLTHARWQFRLIYQSAKQQAGQIDFDDLLHQLYHALQGEVGETFAQSIRAQYPVALVDEFQDTDPWQYGSLMPIYQHHDHCLLLMIGDPKQAIYRFRGADINTYLRARTDARLHHTLTQNFRSRDSLIRAVNHLFILAEDHPKAAFRHKNDKNNPIPFVEVSAGKSLAEFIVNGQPQAPLTLWAMQPNEWINKEDYQQGLAAVCADQILSLLNNPQTGFQTDKGIMRCQAQDIAILVRTRHEAKLMKEALNDRAVPHVYLSDKESIFSSEEAIDMWRWLVAVNEPESIRAIRAALASRSFAFSLTELDAFTDQESVWDEWVMRFHSWRDTWQQQGVLAMIYRLLHELEVARYWQQKPNGERRLTNLLHLAELLQKASLEREGRTAVIRWLIDQINQPQASTAQEHLVRLETDAASVTIITIHKSKGLEYPLVFLPFVMTIGMDKKNSQDDAEREVSWQESIRLLYVALTRASYAMWLGVAGFKSTGTNAGFYESALGYLLSGEDHRENNSQWAQSFHPWLMQAGSLISWQELGSIPLLEGMEQAMKNSYHSSLLKTALIPKLRCWPYWSVSSFSRLTRQLDAHFISASEFRLLESLNDSSKIHESEARSEFTALEPTPWQDLPAGAAIGEMMHDALQMILEEASISNASYWMSYWEKQLNQHQIPLALRDAFHAWLIHLADHPIPLISHSTTLTRLTADKFWCEMSFTLPVAQSHSKALDENLAGMILVGQDRPRLSYQPLGGLLTGFIDLIFEDNGKYYLIDYKTNKLNSGYDDKQCQKAMLAHRYDLQAMIYLLALHRLLSTRLPHYDYEQHMGGAIYWFIRASNTELPMQGFWHFKPSLAELTQFSDFFRSNPS